VLSEMTPRCKATETNCHREAAARPPWRPRIDVRGVVLGGARVFVCNGIAFFEIASTH
jgi:hypothetical protein